MTEQMPDTTTDGSVAAVAAAEAAATAQPIPAQAAVTPHQQFLGMLPEEMRSDPAFRNFQGGDLNEVISKMAKSYVNAQKLVGADKNALLKIPTSEDADGWGEVWEKLGRPTDVSGYGLEDYKDVPGIDQEKLKGFAEKLYQKGVTKDQFKTAVNTYLEDVGMAREQMEKNTEETLAQYEADLKKTWGEAYEQKVSKVLGAIKEKADPAFLELAKDYPWIFDHPAVMRTFDNILKTVSEDTGRGSGFGPSAGRLSPDEAKAEIAAFETDPEKMKILMNPSDPRRDGLLKEKKRLFEAAFPQ